MEFHWPYILLQYIHKVLRDVVLTTDHLNLRIFIFKEEEGNQYGHS
jgi:hypothetical protein